MDTKELMDDLGIDYETINVREKEEALIFLKNVLGVRSTPVVLLDNGDFWTGFDRQRIESLCETKDSPPPS